MRKTQRFLLVMVAVFIFIFFAIRAQAVSLLDGDLTGDGLVKVDDALKALRVFIGLEMLTPDYLAHGDVGRIINGTPIPDGKLDIADILAILRRSAGLITWQAIEASSVKTVTIYAENFTLVVGGEKEIDIYVATGSPINGLQLELKPYSTLQIVNVTLSIPDWFLATNLLDFTGATRLSITGFDGKQGEVLVAKVRVKALGRGSGKIKLSGKAYHGFDGVELAIPQSEVNYTIQ